MTGKVDAGGRTAVRRFPDIHSSGRMRISDGRKQPFTFAPCAPNVPRDFVEPGLGKNFFKKASVLLDLTPFASFRLVLI